MIEITTIYFRQRLQTRRQPDDSVHQLGQPRVFAFEHVQQPVVTPDAAHGDGDEINTQRDEAGIEGEQGHQPVDDLAHAVGIGCGDEHAQHRERKGEHRDARAQRRERCAFFCEQ